MRHLFENSEINENAESEWVTGLGLRYINALFGALKDSKYPMTAIENKRRLKPADIALDITGQPVTFAEAQERGDVRFLQREFKTSQVYSFKTNLGLVAFNHEGFAFGSAAFRDVQTEFFPWKMLDGISKTGVNTIVAALKRMFDQETQAQGDSDSDE